MRPQISRGDIQAPGVDSVADTFMNEVIGNKSDSHAGSSLMGKITQLLEHVHTPSKVYPTLADGVQVDTDAAAWTLGAFTAIVPASTITDDFDIHHISIENISADGVYELVLYYGATDIECGRVRFTRTVLTEAVLNIPMRTNLIPANSQIRAKLASNSGNDDATISVFYHEY